MGRKSGAKKVGPKTLRFALASFYVVTLGACSKDDGGQVSFDKNVESCICRTLAFEADSFSGMSYPVMIERCNETVHSANPARYPPTTTSAPQVEALRCPEDVDDWRAEAQDRADGLLEHP